MTPIAIFSRIGLMLTLASVGIIGLFFVLERLLKIVGFLIAITVAIIIIFKLVGYVDVLLHQYQKSVRNKGQVKSQEKRELR